MNSLEVDLKRDFRSSCTKQSCQFLTTFAFIQNDHGLKIAVVGCMELVKFPSPSHFIKGYIDLRGDKIAIIDPGILLGKKPIEASLETCLVLSEFDVAGFKTKLGIIVADISEVLCIASHSSNCKEKIPSSSNVEFARKLGSGMNMESLLKRIERTMKENKVSTRLYSGNSYQKRQLI